MRRQIPGLDMQANPQNLPDGLFLVRVYRAEYNPHPQKPFLALTFLIVEPEILSGHKVSGRIYCTQRALWKVSWFLRDFGYDRDLLGRDEIDEKALTGLVGIVHTSWRTIGRRMFLNLEAFATRSDWNSNESTEKRRCRETL